MEQNQSKKSFFETYQTFFALVICGVLVGAAIIIGNVTRPNSNGGGAEEVMTQNSVRADLIKTAKQVGLDKNALAACLDNGTNKQKVADAVTLAEKSGVSGTPTFFVIKKTFNAEGKVTSEKQWSILGARDLATFEQSIKEEKSPEGQPEIIGDKIVISATDHSTNANPETAQITLVEYSDIDCPFCKRAVPVVEQLLKNNPDYAFVYRHSPIVSLHPFAAYKAEATECAYDQGADTAEKDSNFWKLLKVIEK